MPGIERRCEPRRSYHAPIRFIVKGKEDKVLKGVIHNISLSGLGMYSFVRLLRGQTVILKSGIPGKHVNYVVRWHDKLAEDFYAVGLRMVE